MVAMQVPAPELVAQDVQTGLTRAPPDPCPQVHFGGGSDKFIMGSQMKQELGAAIVVALHALGTDSKCAGLFGLTGSAGNKSPIAQQVLSNLFPAGNVLQFFNFAPIRSNGSYVTSATTLRCGEQ
jgi:hypothetical protein